jgi:hypothetical protein
LVETFSTSANTACDIPVLVCSEVTFFAALSGSFWGSGSCGTGQEDRVFTLSFLERRD